MVYNIKDAFTVSYAEKQRNSYKAVLIDLDSRLQSIRENIDTVKQTVAAMNDAFLYRGGGRGANLGRFSLTFHDKAEEHAQQMRRILDNMDRAYYALNAQRTAAQNSLSFWEQKCIEEDVRQEEYKP